MKPDRSGAAGRFEPENPHNVRDLSAYATTPLSTKDSDFGEDLDPTKG